MYINNRQKIEDDQKEMNDNNNDNNKNVNINENNKNKLKIFGKIKLSKPNKNISLLPKLMQKEKKLKNAFIRSSSDLIVNKYQIDQKEKEDYKEELLIIKNLWEELGVTKEYKKQFNNLLLNESIRKIMFYQEKENLQKFRNSLMKLRKEIINRENNIESLLKIIRILEGQKMEENLLKEVVNIIKSLRLNAVNIVFYMMKVRELAFYNYFQGKWDLTKIKRDYLYNNSYLLKMKDDLYFLNNSILNNYIELNELPTDPFLTNCIQRKNNNNNEDKIIIPITDELSKLIDQCKFIIIQDQLLDNIYNNNYSSQFNSRANSGKIRIRKYSASNRGQSQGIFNCNKNKELNNSLNKYNQNNIINLSKTIYQLKNENPSDYNNLFVNNQIPNLNSNLKETRKLFESTRIKLRTKDRNKLFKNSINNYMQNYDNSKRIIVEHDILDSFNNRIKNRDNNMKKNIIINCDENNFSSDNIENKLYKTNIVNNNVNNLEKEKIKNIIDENEKLKKDNEEIKKELINSKKIMEKNENLRKNLENKLQEQKEEMEKLSKSVEEIKQQLIKEKKEMEEKLKEEKEKNIKIDKINKEMEEKIKKQNLINKEIEMGINEKNKKKRRSESIKEDNDYIQNNKTEENFMLNDKENRNIKNKYLNNNIYNDKTEENKFINDNESELKEDFDKKENENKNLIFAITNSENEIVNEKNKNKETNNDIIKENKNKKDNYYNNNNNESIKNIENSNENMNNENDKSNEEINKIIEQENDKIYAKQLSEKIVEEIINMKEYEISPNNKYKAEYYKGSIISLINSLKSSIPLENIDPKIKTTFDIEKNIYNEESYLIGQYPLIIVCRSYEKESKITGICSFYYQNTAKNENKIKINFICAIQDNFDNKENDNDIFEQFIAMINFIKNFVSFDELYITLNYKKIILEEEKIEFILEPKILDFFKNQMGFSWFCIENIKGQGRRQQLYYINNNINGIKSDIKNYLNSESLFLLSFMKKDNIQNINYNFYNFKYMNNLPIYAILTSQKEILLIDFKDNKYRFDSSKLNSKENPIINLFFPENKTLEELKLNLDKDNNNIWNIIEDSMFLEYYYKYKENIYSSGLFQMNFNIFFENILITNINHYYYNRISSNEIEIIKDTKNDCVLYNIPTLNKINNILVFEANNKIKKLFIDNNSNIYDLFINYYNIINEVNNNKRIKKKNYFRNIYIPSFSIKTHLQTETFSKEINNINIQNIEENKNFQLGTLDEYLKVDFNKKKIENQIFYEVNEDKYNNDKDIIIKNDFILCILKNYTEIKYPLYQLIYITKENWIKEAKN